MVPDQAVQLVDVHCSYISREVKTTRLSELIIKA